MSEYVCELPLDDMVSFVSGSVRIPVRGRVTRCRDCVCLYPKEQVDGSADWCDNYGADWCVRYDRPMDGHDFCSLAKPRDGGRGERGVDPATCVPDGGDAR